MNERIQALAEQAGYLPDMFGIGHWDMPECKKFAQLIVEECADVGSQWAEDLIDTKHYAFVNKKIKQHFGVDEPKEAKGWVCSKCGIDRTKQVCPDGVSAALTGHCPMIGIAQ